MGYLTIATIIVSICFLAYQSGKMSWKLLPQWLSFGTQPPTETGDADQPQRNDVMAEEESEEGDSTPKVQATNGSNDVPSFSISNDSEDAPKPIPQQPVAPSFPAPNRAQRTTSMAPPAKPMPPPNASNGLMPPPSVRPPPVQRAAPPSAASGLRIPSNGPIPSRGPPSNSQQRASGGLAPNGTAASIPNPRNKVLLSPGHSPMDWAALTRSGKNMSGIDGYRRITPSELKKMTGRKGKPAWSSWQNKVYNITPYLPFHPGGESELMKAAGRDGAKLFMEVHPWVNWENMLSSCLVGMLVPEGDAVVQQESPLEGLD